MVDLYLTADMIIKQSSLLNKHRLLMTAGQEIDIYIPASINSVHFEIVQLSEFRLSIHANGPNSYFLWGGSKNIITMRGNEEDQGSRIKFDWYKGHWLIRPYPASPESLSFQE